MSSSWQGIQSSRIILVRKHVLCAFWGMDIPVCLTSVPMCADARSQAQIHFLRDYSLCVCRLCLSLRPGLCCLGEVVWPAGSCQFQLFRAGIVRVCTHYHLCTVEIIDTNIFWPQSLTAAPSRSPPPPDLCTSPCPQLLTLSFTLVRNKQQTGKSKIQRKKEKQHKKYIHIN